MILPYTRDTARPHMGRKIVRTFDPEKITAPLFGITDTGVMLGTMECGPFLTYQWMADNCVFADDGLPCGVDTEAAKDVNTDHLTIYGETWTVPYPEVKPAGDPARGFRARMWQIFQEAHNLPPFRSLDDAPADQ